MRTTLTLMQERFLIFILFASVAAVVLSPLYSNNSIPDILDYLNHITTIGQAKLALLEGQFPIRVMPLQNSGMSYPLFQFYSSTSYLISGVIYFFTPGNPYIALKIMLWGSLFCGGIYMYLLTLWFVPSKQAALLAGVVYLTSPYFIIVVDHMGAFNEAVALGMLPAVIYYSLRRYYFPSSTATLLQASMAWFLLATTHIVTFFYTSFFTAILLMLATFKNRHYFFNLFAVGIAYLFGCILSVWYFAPILHAKKYLNIDTIYGISSIFSNFHTSISTLLSPGQMYSKPVIQGDGYADAILQFQPSVGVALLIGVGVSIYYYLSKNSSLSDKSVDHWILPLLIIFMIAFIMVWSPFNFWDWLPRILMIGQYSWRILGQVIWIGAILFAWAAVALFGQRLDHRYTMLGIVLIILSSSVWLNLSEGQLKPIPITAIAKTPIMLWNTNTFLINIKHNKDLVNVIDRIAVDLDGINNKLEFNTTYYFPETVLANTINPVITLEGSEVDPAFSPKHEMIDVIVNDKLNSRFELKPGLFQWSIPFNLVQAPVKNKIFSILLKPEGDSANKSLFIKEMSIGGFLNPATVVTLEQAMPHCHRDKGKMLCEIQTTDQTKLIELPILYYPEMLKITQNGKAVDYFSVLNQKNLIAAIVAKPGTMNSIAMQFVGLTWANRISFFAFLIWIGLFIWTNTQDFLIKKFIFNNENLRI